jgi:hypothetical protein
MTVEDVADFTGELVRLVPVGGVGVNLFGDIGEMLAQEIERALRKSSGSALHGARIAGQTAALGAEALGTWVAVGGEAGDGHNCVDCLELHGTEMSKEQFDDTKYTTACDGNCRCVFVPGSATDDAKQIEAIATSELEDEA